MIKCVAHKTVQDWGKDNESESRIPKFSFVHDPQRVAEWQLAQVYNGERPWRAGGDGKASVDDAFILQLKTKSIRLKNELARAEEEMQLVKQDMHSALIFFETVAEAHRAAVESCRAEASRLASADAKREEVREKQGLVFLFNSRLARVERLGEEAGGAFKPVLGFALAPYAAPPGEALEEGGSGSELGDHSEGDDGGDSDDSEHSR